MIRKPQDQDQGVFTLSFQKGRKLVPTFFTESNVRKYLQALYISTVGATDNARLILERDLSDADPKFFAGNKLVIACSSWMRMWLKFMREFSRSAEIYSLQFLEPVKLLANFRLTARKTTTLTGLLFSKSSRFYDKYFSGDVRTLAIIIPSLQTVMSIRCRDELAGEVGTGGLLLNGIQPMPYVNRIHPHQLDIERNDERPSLSSLDFLKVSVDDLELFRTSMAFENFCEIESGQLRERRRRTGAPCIICGRLICVRPPSIILKGYSGRLIRLHMNHNLPSNSCMDLHEISSLEGKFVRVLVVHWYGKGQTVPTPEAFILEEVESEDEILHDEVCGFVRLRIRLQSSVVFERFPQASLQMSAHINVRGENIEWQPVPAPGEPFLQAFHNTQQQIRMLRLRNCYGKVTTLVDLRGVLDWAKLRKEWLVKKLTQDEGLLRFSLGIIKYGDDQGVIPRKISELRGVISGIFSDSVPVWYVYWLLNTRLIKRTGDRTVISELGHHVVYSAVKNALISALRNALNEKTVMSLDELEERTGFAPSLILSRLQELEEEGVVHCLELSGKRCELIWFTIRPTTASEDPRASAAEKFRALKEKILALFGEFHHPLHPLKVIELMQQKGHVTSYRALLSLLVWLEKEGILSHDGEMWEYPWRRRITDILNGNPTCPFTIEAIMRLASIPPFEAEKVKNILTELEEEREIWQPVPGRWFSNPRDDIAREIQLRTLLLNVDQEFITKILREKEWAEDRWLEIESTFHVRKFAEKIGFKGNLRQIHREAISELISQKRIMVFQEYGLTKYRLILLNEPD